MLSAKEAQILARASRNRGSLAYRIAHRRRNGGQSIIVAIIVLFLLLFLGGVFIALIANNLRNTRRGVQVSAADKFAQAGIQYLDQQLMTSPEGADWRPVPRCLPNNECQVVGGPKELSANDPDYFWLKQYNPVTDEGGYTRINFGGPTPSRTNLGGRALVRISYRPYRVTAGGVFWDDLNGNGTFEAGSETVNPALADRTRRYIRLESIGRVGVIDELDPTTYRNTEGLGLRRELVAYKALGLTDALRFITDKDKRRTAASLGAPYTVFDRDRERYIFNVFQGPIRSNTDLTFYGMNYLSLDSRRGEALEVAGSIGLNRVNSNTTVLQQQDPTKVYVRDVTTGGGATVGSLSPLATGSQIGSVFPSGSNSFTTLGALVRDNPRGSETQDLPDASQNSNLRAMPRLDPPLIDAVVGDNGLTRYRALTRDSAPMAPAQVAPNPIGINANSAGSYGWGQNLYIPNAVDLPVFSEAAGNVTSQRAEWLNSATNNTLANNWKSDNVYAPNAVTITLTPRWFSMARSAADNRVRSYLRRPQTGGNIAQQTVYRYTYATNGNPPPRAENASMAEPPTFGIDDTDGTKNTPPANPAEKYAGYPAVRVQAGYYEGDFIIFAEGNVRIKGTAGGYDPETGNTFVRHLTIVSNGSIYVDGSLLRDNISPEMAASNLAAGAAKGKSTIALLAKNYVAVNTTQFLSPSLQPTPFQDPSADGSGTSKGLFVTQLSASTGAQNRQEMTMTPGPINSYDAQGLPIVNNVYNNGLQDLNRIPPYLTRANSLSLLARHAPAGDGQATINLFINTYLNGGTIEENDFGSFTLGTTTTPPTPRFYTDNVYPLNLAPGTTTDYFFPTNGFPYLNTGAGTVTTMPTIGMPNKMALEYDPAGAGVNYNIARYGVVPMDVRIEALMYAQEGSFFIIPGPWFNPNSNDTYGEYVRRGNRRAEQDTASTTGPDIVSPSFPFFGEPLDTRITFFGAISENLPAEIGDQGAWLQKWGWVPQKYGSTGLAGTPGQGSDAFTFHGPSPDAAYNMPSDGVGNGINYIYDPRLAAPYDAGGTPLRLNTNFTGLATTQMEPLPPMPRLPVAPGLLFYGERPVR